MAGGERRVNREDRRRLARGRRTWLSAVAADPRTSTEELLVAQWLAEHADEHGVVAADAERIAREVARWPR